jgi:hypothetical protein
MTNDEIMADRNAIALFLRQQSRGLERQADDLLAWFSVPRDIHPMPSRIREPAPETPLDGISLDEAAQAIATKELLDLKSRLHVIAAAVDAGRLAEATEGLFTAQRFLHVAVASWYSTGAERLWDFEESRRASQRARAARAAGAKAPKYSDEQRRHWVDEYQRLKASRPNLSARGAAEVIRKKCGLPEAAFATIRGVLAAKNSG